MKETTRVYLKITLLGLLFMMSLFLGLYVYQQSIPKTPHLHHATYVGPGRMLSAFELQKTDAQVLNLSHLVGHWTILFFGYTQCRSICPTTMDMMHHVYDKLRQDGILQRPEMIMISLDGDRDSLETMRHYVTGFDKEFKGAIGQKSMVQKLTQELGVVYDSQSDQNDGQIDHSGSLTLINPAGEVVAFFIPPMQVQDIAQDIETLTKTFKIR